MFSELRTTSWFVLTDATRQWHVREDIVEERPDLLAVFLTGLRYRSPTTTVYLEAAEYVGLEALLGVHLGRLVRAAQERDLCGTLRGTVEVR